MRMQPRRPRAIAGIERDRIASMRRGQQSRDGVEQLLHPFPAQRRQRDDVLAPRGFAEQFLAFVRVEQVELVPRLDPRNREIDANVAQHRFDVVSLRDRVGMRDVADVDQQIGRDHLLERRFERRDQLRRQFGHEADRVGQDRLVDAWERNLAERRVQRGEEQILRHDVSPSHPVEKRRLSGIGIADQRNHRPRRTLATVAVQAAGTGDLFELLLEPRHTVTDQAAIGLDLRFARAAQKAEATALTFQVSPAPHQPPRLIIQMRELDLQPPLRRRGTLPEDFQDQASPVDHLGRQRLFEVALLHRGQARIEHDQLGLHHADRRGERLELALADQRRGLKRADLDRDALHHFDVDRHRKPCRLGQPTVRIACRCAGIGIDDDGLCTARYIVMVTFKSSGQSSSEPAVSSAKLRGCAGWIVETACL